MIHQAIRIWPFIYFMLYRGYAQLLIEGFKAGHSIWFATMHQIFSYHWHIHSYYIINYINNFKEPKTKVSSLTQRKTYNWKYTPMPNSLENTIKVLLRLIPELPGLFQDLSSCYVLVPTYGHINCKHSLPYPFVKVKMRH